MDRRGFLAGAGTAAAIAAAGCLSAFDDGYDIGMTADEFRPESYTIEVGETVVWENTSTRAHTVTAYGNAIPEDAEYFATGGYATEQDARDAWHAEGGGRIDHGEQYSHTFEIPGRYEYVCLPHEVAGMVGTIVVE